MSEITLRIDGRYRREQTDAGRLRTALHVEEVAALAYRTAAERVLEGEERAVAERFAAQEREHDAGGAHRRHQRTLFGIHRGGRPPGIGRG